MSIKFIKKYNVFFHYSQGKNSKGQQRGKSDSVGKKNTGYSRHCCLITDNHSPKGRVGIPETSTSFPRHWIQLQTSLVMSSAEQGHRTKVTFVLPLGPLRISWILLAPHSIRVAMSDSHDGD